MRLGRSTLTPHAPHRHGMSTGAGPVVSLTMLSAAVAVPILLFSVLAPAALILPLFGMTSLVYALAFALIAQWRPDIGAGVTWWDVAGAFAFIGFAAVLLSRPEVLPLLAH